MQISCDIIIFMEYKLKLVKWDFVSLDKSVFSLNNKFTYIIFKNSMARSGTRVGGSKNMACRSYKEEKSLTLGD